MVWRAVLATGLVLAAAASAARAVDITSGPTGTGASMNILETFQIGQPYPFATVAGDAALKLEGSASPDVLYKYCWYYRTSIGNARLFSALLAPSKSVAGDTVTFTWTSNGDGPVDGGGRFDATLSVTVEDGAEPGAGRVRSELRIRNANSSAATFRIYHMADLDLPGGTPNTATDDLVGLSSEDPLIVRYTEGSSLNYGEVYAPGADHHRIDSGLALRGLLPGATIDLASETGPYSGDGAVAAQWTLSLAPGEERVIRTALSVNMPAETPACRADFNGQGGVTVQDIFDFLAAYFGGQPSADINGQGGVTVQDVFDYLVLYFAGCP